MVDLGCLLDCWAAGWLGGCCLVGTVDTEAGGAGVILKSDGRLRSWERAHVVISSVQAPFFRHVKRFFVCSHQSSHIHTHIPAYQYSSLHAQLLDAISQFTVRV